MSYMKYLRIIFGFIIGYTIGWGLPTYFGIYGIIAVIIILGGLIYLTYKLYVDSNPTDKDLLEIPPKNA